MYADNFGYQGQNYDIEVLSPGYPPRSVHGLTDVGNRVSHVRSSRPTTIEVGEADFGPNIDYDRD